ncbi:polysaccharide deacetylase family protein [Mucilaginibacter arboris]|uniref:Uncharacterized protein n=1 Tax=Mucilaginibacter arboris TaxID=2682090 RepID=A0A7K1SYP3_9SPHI|nr:hypothetical protein [Mucilaginibacter arboris]MVN22444.1 hypothetical protein [Mucilaginibacter arboris]
MNAFSFNSVKYNFWPLYEAIKLYYPIGIPHDSSLYINYPGIKNLTAVIIENIHNSDNYNRNWVSFQKEISQKFNIEVIGTTYGQAPSFSCDLIIENFEHNQLKRTKKLSLAVSLAGKFFTIYGVDETIITDKNEDNFDSDFHAINALAVSPYKEFELVFKDLKSMVEAKFTSYKFVPFAINSMFIKGLQVRYLFKEECTIYNALFNHLLDTYDTKKSPRGDKHYGYDDWLVEDYNPENDINITLTPPNP